MKIIGELEKQLIDLCHQCPPDLEAIKAKIAEGADVNANNGGAISRDSLLSEVIYHFGYIDLDNHSEKYGCKFLPDVIKIILDAGFNVTLDEGKYGAMCLSNLILCVIDKYILDAAKLLLDAGADANIAPYDDTPYDSALQIIWNEESFLRCEWEYEDAAILYQLGELIESHMEGKNGENKANEVVI